MSNHKLQTSVKSANKDKNKNSKSNVHQMQNGITTIRADKLYTKKFPKQKWIIQNLIPEYGLAILAGVPKIGKSWFALEVATSVATGKDFAGNNSWKVTKGSVLYFALEDHERRTQERLAKLTDMNASLKNLEFAYQVEPMNGNGISILNEHINLKPKIKLVIIDTLAKTRESQREKREGYQQDVEFTSRIQRLALDNKISILAVHHTRKREAKDPLVLVSGTYGITASADAIYVLNRGRNSDEAKLSVTGRDITEAEYALSCKDWKWRCKGLAETTMISNERKAIIRCLEENGPLIPKDIATKLGKNDGTIRKLLKSMLGDTQVYKLDGGMYSSSVKDTFSDQSPPSQPLRKKKRKKRKKIKLHL